MEPDHSGDRHREGNITVRLCHSRISDFRRLIWEVQWWTRFLVTRDPGAQRLRGDVYAKRCRKVDAKWSILSEPLSHDPGTAWCGDPSLFVGRWSAIYLQRLQIYWENLPAICERMGKMELGKIPTLSQFTIEESCKQNGILMQEHVWLILLSQNDAHSGRHYPKSKISTQSPRITTSTIIRMICNCPRMRRRFLYLTIQSMSLYRGFLRLEIKQNGPFFCDYQAGITKQWCILAQREKNPQCRNKPFGLAQADYYLRQKKRTSMEKLNGRATRVVRPTPPAHNSSRLRCSKRRKSRHCQKNISTDSFTELRLSVGFLIRHWMNHFPDWEYLLAFREVWTTRPRKKLIPKMGRWFSDGSLLFTARWFQRSKTGLRRKIEMWSNDHGDWWPGCGLVASKKPWRLEFRRLSATKGWIQTDCFAIENHGMGGAITLMWYWQMESPFKEK